MEIGAVSGYHILEALEKIQQAGEKLASSGPSPIADSQAQELGRQFESLLEDSSAQENAAPAGGVAAGSGPFAEASHAFGEQASGAAPQPVGAADAVSNPSISPAELYSMQFQTSMLRFSAESGSQVQKQATQGLDSLLRNQS